MSIKLQIFSIFLLLVFITSILLVAFGQITVRRLRKNPEIRSALGFEYVSGRDIFNVAQALGLPIGMIRKLRSTKLGFLYADPDVLLRYTSRFDRILGRLFFWSYMSTGLIGVIFLILNSLDFFK